MMPALSACTSSPVPGTRTTIDDVGRADDVDLVLADADGLDDDPVLAGRVEHVGRVVRRPRQPAEVAARGHAPDEHAVVAGVRLHADAVAEDRAAGERAGGIDGDDADRLAAPAQLQREPVHQRALAGARRAR